MRPNTRKLCCFSLGAVLVALFDLPAALVELPRSDAGILPRLAIASVATTALLNGWLWMRLLGRPREWTRITPAGATRLRPSFSSGKNLALFVLGFLAVEALDCPLGVLLASDLKHLGFFREELLSLGVLFGPVASSQALVHLHGDLVHVPVPSPRQTT
jgi:hypothetical protein